MRRLIVGSQARAAGTVTGHDLRRGYDRVHRDIYKPRGLQLSLDERIDGAWLRTGRAGVVAGVAAAALHGARWIDDTIAVEMIWKVTRAPVGIIVRRDRLAPDEITVQDCVAVTTPERTAFDIARYQPRGAALALLDALQRSTAFEVDDVAALADRYRGARGVKQVRELLPLVDGGAQSPPETRLRLLFIDAGLCGRPRRSRCSTGPAAYAGSTWAGRSSRLRSNTTAASIRPTAASTSRISGCCPWCGARAGMC